jgi:hypothetical protein
MSMAISCWQSGGRSVNASRSAAQRGVALRHEQFRHDLGVLQQLAGDYSAAAASHQQALRRSRSTSTMEPPAPSVSRKPSASGASS